MKIYYFIRKSFPIQFNNFVASTPIPGLKFINCYERKYQQFFWYAVLKLSLLTMMAVSLEFFNQYKNRSMLKVFKDLEQGQPMAYPAVYLCLARALNPKKLAKYRKTFLKSNLSMSISDIDLNLQRMFRFQRSALNASYDFHELLDNVEIDVLQENLFNLYYKVDELFEKCSFQGDPIECAEIFIPVETAPGYCFVFNSIYTHESFHDDPQEVSYAKFYEFDEDWTLRFKMLYGSNNSALIYLKHPHNIISLADYPTHVRHERTFNNQYGFSITDYYTEENIRDLSLSQRHCFFPDETFVDEDLRSEFKTNFYNVDVCLNYCYVLKFMEMCNCMPTFGKYIFPKLAKKTNVGVCGIKDMECYERSYISVRQTDCKACLRSCNYTAYAYGFLPHNAPGLYDSINKTALKKEEALDFTIYLDYWPLMHICCMNIFRATELMLALGSSAGLFLGFSILTFFEILYNLLMRFPCFFFVNKKYFMRTLKKRQEIDRKSTKPYINMSLRPFGKK